MSTRTPITNSNLWVTDFGRGPADVVHAKVARQIERGQDPAHDRYIVMWKPAHSKRWMRWCPGEIRLPKGGRARSRWVDAVNRQYAEIGHQFRLKKS